MERKTEIGSGPASLVVDHLFRSHHGQLVSALIRILGPCRIDLAEDAVQESMIRALRHWGMFGIPEYPAAWLIAAAKNAAIDALRRERADADRIAVVAALPDYRSREDPERLALAPFADDQIMVMFGCCHPAVTAETQIALILKIVGGFSAAEIARGFLTAEASIAQRLVRGKRTLRDLGTRIEMPRAEECAARLPAVQQALYLVFNEGYSAGNGDTLLRRDLCSEAIRMARILARHPLTAEPASHALLALMLLQASRFDARVSPEGELVLLRDQDRSNWDRRLIAEGFDHLLQSASGRDLTRFHLEAGIAGCHAAAGSYEETDWVRILEAYDALIEIDPSPVIALNRAIAVSEVHGPSAAMTILDRIAMRPRAPEYAWLHAARGHLYERLGRYSEAKSSYARALNAVSHSVERRFLQKRIDRLEDVHHAPA